MKRSGAQYKLFETGARLGNGLRYRPDFITPDEEEALLAWVSGQELMRARGGASREYEAKRRHAGFGWGYDYRNERLVPGPPLPPFLGRFARRIEKWLDLSRGRVVEALVNEYTEGAGLGWHRDNEPFEHVVGISLAGWVKMRFRPLRKRGEPHDPKEVVGLELEPRSVYVMQDEVRWRWQHSVASARTLRYSITFRTLPKGNRVPNAISGRKR